MVEVTMISLETLFQHYVGILLDSKTLKKVKPKYPEIRYFLKDKDLYFIQYKDGMETVGDIDDVWGITRLIGDDGNLVYDTNGILPKVESWIQLSLDLE